MKKLISIILSLLTVISLIPFTYVPVSAAETCTCTTKCTEGSVNSECAVCFANGGEPGTCTGTDSAAAVYADGITVTIDTGESVTLQDADGDGYYEISTADELYAFAAAVNGNNLAINGELTADIVVNQNVLVDGALNSNTEGFRVWKPMAGNIYRYNGTFDGGDHTISGLYFNNIDTRYVGLFGYVSHGIVKNVGVVDSYFSGFQYVGGVVGKNDGTVTDCYNTGPVMGLKNNGGFNTSDYIGGVVGYNNGGTVTGCYNTGNISGIDDVGGVVGYNCDGTVTGCYNTGNVSGKISVGGVVGDNSGAITGCYNIGNASGVERVGGVAGYNTGTVQSCYSMGNVSGSTSVGGVAGRNNGGTVAGCYYDNTVYTGDAIDIITNGGTATDVLGKTTEQFASGEVAYLLQGEQTEQVWGQSIGTDAYPVLGGAQVYYGYISSDFDAVKVYTNDANATAENVHAGEVKYTPTEDGKQHIAKCSHCGKEIYEDHTGGTATCTTPAVCDTCGESYGELAPDNHEYEKNNGICCGTYQSATLNADGYYEIFNAGQLFWFANYINTVDRTASAVLTADIDLENRPWTPIGSTGENSNNFRGVFDGQNHTIKGLYVEGGRAGLGFFGEVRTGTVKNFTIYGEVVVNTEVNYVGGVIGSICGLNSTDHGLERNGAVIQNITSYVNLTAKAHGIGMIGGFVGYANHQSLIENCSWYGTFDAGIYRVDSGAGGFIGKIQEYTSEVTIRNCAAYGTIKTGYAGDYNNTATIYMGGFLSFSNTNAQTTLENCLFAGKFERGESLTDKAFLGAFGTLRSVNAIKNCYYLGDDGLEAVHSDSPLKPKSDNVEITSVTGEQLKSGEVAYLLGRPFGQNIGTEFAPVLYGETVYTVRNCKNEVTYSNTNEDLDHNYVSGACTVCGAADPDYTEPEFILGDVNGDGTINGKDTNLLKQIISGSSIPDEAQKLASDVNGDGNVNGVDANLISQFLAGNIGGF